jgi:Carboxypeptidase regulatory-like domain/CarboxypepD_reg-like domain
MMKPTRLIALACASVFALAAAGAQDTAPNLRGKVISISGNPIDGVEVRIEGSPMITRSSRDGTFAFVNAPKGSQVLLFRLLGYLPTKSLVRVPNTDIPVTTMLPTPRNLDTVRVTASLNVLAGVVVDDKNRPIPGASVEMVSGTNLSATTDSSGWFTFTSVRSGTVLVRARKLGFTPLTTSLRLEDWRGVVIHLEPIDDKMSASKLEDASGFGNTSTFAWRETQQRLAMKGSRAIVIPREELEPFDDYPLGQAIQRTPTGSTETSDLNAASTNICVLLNGKNTVGPSSLGNFRTEDVEFVELYPPGTEMSGSVVRYLRNAGCRRVSVPGSFVVGVFYAVVWLR